MRIARSLIDLVGNTPLVRLDRLFRDSRATVVAKLESFNPGHSEKDRAALAMVLAAEREGKLRPGMTIVEPTDGNTGIALAWVAAVRGYKVILTMPESMSVDRHRILALLGAQVVLTPAHLAMNGAVARARELAAADPNTFSPLQFENPANPQIHRDTTAEEIWRDTDGKVDVFVAGVGTGGTLTGVGEVLKARKSGVRIVAVEPRDSAVLSGSKPGPHHILGIGAGFVPRNLNRSVIDEIVTVADDEALAMTARLAREEGILVGIAAGAVVSASAALAARKDHAGKMTVVLLPDAAAAP
jgi:cysteine synthase A